MYIHFLNVKTAGLTNQPEFKHVINLSEYTGSHHQCPTSTQTNYYTDTSAWKMEATQVKHADMRFSK
jgi:hypothetical protein